MSTGQTEAEVEAVGKPGRTVTVHFLCAGCGHDLFTRPLGSSCPECGRLVREGLPSGERLAFFVIDPVSFDRQVRDVTIKLGCFTAAIWVIISAATLAVSDIASSVGFSVLMLIFQYFNYTRQLRSMRLSLLGWRLIVGHDGMLSRLPGSRDVFLHRNETTGVAELHRVGLTIYGATPRQRIEIYEGMAGYAELRAQLLTWAPIRAHHSDWQEVFVWGARFTIIIGGTYLTRLGPAWAAILGLLLLVPGIAWAAWSILHSPTMQRRKAWFMVTVLVVGGICVVTQTLSRF